MGGSLSSGCSTVTHWEKKEAGGGGTPALMDEVRSSSVVHRRLLAFVNLKAFFSLVFFFLFLGQLSAHMPHTLKCKIMPCLETGKETLTFKKPNSFGGEREQEIQAMKTNGCADL